MGNRSSQQHGAAEVDEGQSEWMGVRGSRREEALSSPICKHEAKTGERAHRKVLDQHNPPVGGFQYSCGGPTVLDGEVMPVVRFSDRTDAVWRRSTADLMRQDDAVLLYRIVVSRPPYELWAFYNDTKNIQFHVTIHFDPHQLQKPGILMPLGATTLSWQEDGSALAKLVVYPAATALSVEGHMVAYCITIEGLPR